MAAKGLRLATPEVLSQAPWIIPETGLGTSIVEALAHELGTTVHKSSGPQGTTVTITASAV
jgi:signal transduction histidine kinase